MANTWINKIELSYLKFSFGLGIYITNLKNYVIFY